MPGLAESSSAFIEYSSEPECWKSGIWGSVLRIATVSLGLNLFEPTDRRLHAHALMSQSTHFSWGYSWGYILNHTSSVQNRGGPVHKFKSQGKTSLRPGRQSGETLGLSSPADHRRDSPHQPPGPFPTSQESHQDKVEPQFPFGYHSLIHTFSLSC